MVTIGGDLNLERKTNGKQIIRLYDDFYFQIFNAEVLFRDDCTADQFIDVIMGNRVYMNCLYVYNKIDQVSLEEVDRLANLPNSVVISCYMKLNLGKLICDIEQ